MNMNMRKILALVVVAVAIPLFFSGCNKKPAVKACKTDAECKVDASGNPQNGVCYMGKCEECVENSDCSGLKQCINHRCEATCLIDADCGPGKHCEGNICYNDCTGNESCKNGRTCAGGRCLSELGLNSGGECQNTKIHFDFDRYDIKPSEREQVENTYKCLESKPGATLLLEGHTDEKGTPSYNIALGERRANAVKKELQTRGIEPNRIKTVSYGYERPLDNGKGKNADEQNRRAELIVNTDG